MISPRQAAEARKLDGRRLGVECRRSTDRYDLLGLLPTSIRSVSQAERAASGPWPRDRHAACHGWMVSGRKYRLASVIMSIHIPRQEHQMPCRTFSKRLQSRIRPGGRIVVPPAVLKALGGRPESLVLELQGNRLLLSRRQSPIEARLAKFKARMARRTGTRPSTP